LIFLKIRAALGLSGIVKCASGAAALPAHVSKWFRKLDMEILEDFGQTESTGVLCITQPGVDCAGTVGKPFIGSEFKLESDGEVCTRGRHVFKGYYKNEQATADTVIDGWLHTGDLGEWTPEGLVKIIGRKKDIMKSSGGKMIAPSPIEERARNHEWISQVCIVGDGRKYFTAIITLRETVLKTVQSDPNAQLIQDKDILSGLKEHMDSINRTLAGYERIKYFSVLPRDFSIEHGEVTPTLKMKRNVIEKNFHALIEKMYFSKDDS
jgi:long-chain acyl-CoA synthetase